ncbi:hypothetical protein K7X08_013348 [Anisodus acutangulus]|uniref:Uncharacterized protein n=1 Tax=Anisodus acutangulus TaxID=402998 RepID=A0A9Q1MDZ3_9SOLA|nr:hypothetical protein K7X08_013348 [Anisodus acutangulus]
MASLQCQKPVAQQTVCQKTTTVTCHQANEYHSLADKMKEMAGKVFHHENHGDQLKTIRKKKNRDGRCRDGSDSSSSSSSDESDNENCGRTKRGSC